MEAKLRLIFAGEETMADIDGSYPERFKYLTSAEIIGSVKVATAGNQPCCSEMKLLAERLQDKEVSSEEGAMIEDFFAEILIDPEDLFKGKCIQSCCLAILLSRGEKLSPETICAVALFEDIDANSDIVSKAKQRTNRS